MQYCMKSRETEEYAGVVQDVYEGRVTVVRCAAGEMDGFKAEVGLHQGSTLSPFLFAIVMDSLMNEIRRGSPWTTMFADNIVSCCESSEQRGEP